MRDVFYEAIKDQSGRVYAELQNEYQGRYHFHRAFEIAYIIDGSTRYMVEDEEYLAQSGDIVFAHRYYRHRSYDTGHMSKYVIAVPENLSHDILKLLEDSTLPSLMTDREFNKSVLPYFEALVANNGASDIIVKGYASLIFGLLSEHYHSTAILPKSKNVSNIIDILTYVDEHCEEPITLTDIARTFGYNKSYFSRLFNKHVGSSLSDYINLVRLNRFELLSENESDRSTTELVFKSGFQSLATFYRTRDMRRRGRIGDRG